MEQNREFATTRWSIVRRAADGDVTTARTALQELCQLYWYPLYSFVRYKGYPPGEAEDLTQSFFADLLQRDGIRRVQPELGRFRSFLLAALKNFLANEWDKQQTLKRGGGRVHFSMDFPRAESRFQVECADGETPEAIFERQWALTLLQQVQGQLRTEQEKRGKGHVFERLQGFLAGKNSESTMAQAAAELGMSEVAVKVAVHRLRARFGELLRLKIQSTVDTPDDVEDEISHLFRVLQN